MFRSVLLFVSLFFAVEAISSEEEALQRVFSEYRIGFNNRAVFRQALRHLELTFGRKVDVAFGNRNCVTESPSSGVPTVFLDEAYFDVVFGHVKWIESLLFSLNEQGFVSTFSVSEHIEAVGRFIVAHEYFHVLLRHLDIFKGQIVSGVQTELKGDLLAQALEAQADWLAAVYVREDLGLPLRWPAHFVGLVGVNEKGAVVALDETNQSPRYPPHAARFELVKYASRARPPSFAFNRQGHNCLDQLLEADPAVLILALLRKQASVPGPSEEHEGQLKTEGGG